MKGSYLKPNYSKGMNETYYAPTKDLTVDYLRDENITSLNNFIRYGSYSHGRDHVLTKNKSIADILLLSDAQCTILINFIELCRLNKDIIYNKSQDYEDDLFNKFLVSIQNAPNNLPMYFSANNLDEEIFYYQLIRDILKWIISYNEFCKYNGYNKLYTIGIGDITTFNGYLKEIADIMSEYLIKVRLVYPFDLEKDEQDKGRKMNKEDMKEKIRREVIDEISHEVMERMGCDHHKPPHHHHHHKPAHKKHTYDFEKSGFNVPTLLKYNLEEHHKRGYEQINKQLSGNMIYCDPSALALIPKMDDYDILYLPETYANTKEHLVFTGLKNILIVGHNFDMNYTMEFNDSSAYIQNMTFKKFNYDGSEEVPVETAVTLTGESTIRFEDCIFEDYDLAISVPNEDSYSKADIEFVDSICHNCMQGIETDSPLFVKMFRATFSNITRNALKVTHSNNNKTVITINDSKFIKCGTDEELVDDTAIRLINNKISSRVGITAAYIIDSIFVDNIVDVTIGANEEDITNVDIRTQYNIGLDKIVNLSEKKQEDPDDSDVDGDISNLDESGNIIDTVDNDSTEDFSVVHL